jgi:hypothetical protein
MEKLLKLLNEYEESRWETIDDWLTEEEREEWWSIEYEEDRWREYKWHLRLANANTVAFERDTFDAYALSKKYGFIRWLNDRDMLKPKEIYQQAILDQIKEWHEWEAYTQWLALSDNPISDLISMLK